MHFRNKHKSRYNFDVLTAGTPELLSFLVKNQKGERTINFHNPDAVKALNKALLKTHYQIENWDIPSGYLCPPIPSRADYLHYVADLLASENGGKIPKGNQILCLDVGVGANCIYPIIGTREFGWSFIGSDIDMEAIAFAEKMVAENVVLKNKIDLRLQPKKNVFFEGILNAGERVDLTVCNPPFHASRAEARKGTRRKLKNLKGKSKAEPILNFGGQSNELWCEGGERKFIQKMIRESVNYSMDVLWFSTLVSKESNLKPIQAALKKVKPDDVKIINMQRGNKISRIVAWTFLNEKQRSVWGRLRFS